MFWTLSWYTVGPIIRRLFRCQYPGVENVPKKGPAILASNHLSFLDHMIAALGTKRQVHFISKVEHFDFPIRRFLFQQWGVIPLRRGEGDDEAFQRSADVLRRGELFCIYPEGTRSLDGKLHKGHTGVARLAVISKAPVIPVAMWGTFEAYPKGAKRIKFVKCGARFGQPLDYSLHHGRDHDRELMRKITDEVMAKIRALSGQDYVDEYQYNPEVTTHSRGAMQGSG